MNCHRKQLNRNAPTLPAQKEGRDFSRPGVRFRREPIQLKDESRADLQDASTRAGGASNNVIHRSESGGIDILICLVGVRNEERGMVEDIECIATQLQANGFTYSNGLNNRKIRIEEPRAIERVPSKISKLARARIAEAVWNQR